MMNHSGEKAFACEECKREFAFKTISNGIVHACVKPIFSRQCDEIITNTNSFGVCSCTRVKKPFVCEICDEKGACPEWWKMKSYLKIHVGENPFVCNVCDKKLR